jgi:glycosyltransferase involved in cell wall biosynthesis
MSISITIPFYNAEKSLGDSIRSVFSQTTADWELILLDDGSTDGSLKIAKAVRDSRVRVVSDGQNKGLANRLNQAVQLSRYDFIARMDADDLMSPHRLKTQRQFLTDHGDIDLVSTGLYSVLDDCTPVGWRGADTRSISFDDLVKGRKSFLHAGLLARKCWFQRNRYNETLPVGEDTELWFRASRSSDFRAATLEQPLYIYREAGNLTLNKMLTAYRQERAIIRGYIANPLQRAQYSCRSYAKSARALLLDRLGMLDRLQARRNHGVMSSERTSAYWAILEDVGRTRVPGLDDAR